MIAMMARRPLANTAFNFAVIRPMLLCCVKVTPVHSMRPQKATIWIQPASGTLVRVTELLGLSESLVPWTATGSLRASSIPA